MLAYLKKHIPGEPTVVSEYMPGGGGIKAANHIFKNVRPDGLTIGRVGGGLVANAVLGEKGVLYDLNKFIYLGSPHSTYHWVFITQTGSRLENHRGAALDAGNSRRRAGGGPFKLFRRPAFSPI